MANIKSQIKRIKVSEQQRLRNKAVKTRIKTYIAKFYSEAEVGTDEAEKSLKQAYKVIDEAVSKGVIHPNNAANKKSAIRKKLNNISARAVTKKPAKKTTTAKATAEKKTVKKPATKKTTAKKATATKKTAAKGKTK